MNKIELTKEGREDLAFALILLKDFKAQGRFDPEITLQTIRFAQVLGVTEEYNRLLSQVPPMRIEPR